MPSLTLIHDQTQLLCIPKILINENDNNKKSKRKVQITLGFLTLLARCQYTF